MSAPDTKFLRAFQDHTEMKLNSESLLQYVAIVSQRKQVKLDATKRVAPHIAGRNGKVGAGLLIGLPVIDPADNDVPGAQMVVKLPIDILVKDDLSLVLSNGAGVSAEEVLVITWQLLHQFLNKYLGTGNWTVAGADPIEDQRGAYGYQLVLEVRFGSDQPDKTPTPTFSLAGGNVTLTPFPGSTAYYTLDGSFPANSATINPATHLYAAPFAVTSGQTVLWAAYQANYISSDVWAETIP